MTGQLQLGAWAPPLRGELSQYHTPTKLARRMVEWVYVRGKTVLEPSAGGGNIVRELVAAGAARVIAVEIDPAWVALLRDEFGRAPVDVVEGDFLRLQPMALCDLCVMNGPLNDGVAAEHVARSLEWAPRTTALLRAQDLHGVGRYDQLWCRCDLAREAHLVSRPVFVGEGGATEFDVVDVRRVGTFKGPQRIEHWTF